MNLFVKTDPELGCAYFCPACKRFLCNTEETCRFCGQLLDWAEKKVPYTGPVKWPSMEELTYSRKAKDEPEGKIKVIFLDIDGVLNTDKTSRRTTGGYRFVGSRQLKNLRRIIAETGAKVVLSSDWRYDRDDPKWNSDYLELRNELARYGIRFYGFTPELPSAHRGSEIAQWLIEHPEVSNFVILDDRTDMEPHKDHWVQTVMSHGLGKDETDAAIKILLKG